MLESLQRFSLTKWKPGTIQRVFTHGTHRWEWEKELGTFTKSSGHEMLRRGGMVRFDLHFDRWKEWIQRVTRVPRTEVIQTQEGRGLVESIQRKFCEFRGIETSEKVASTLPQSNYPHVRKEFLFWTSSRKLLAGTPVLIVSLKRHSRKVSLNGLCWDYFSEKKTTVIPWIIWGDCHILRSLLRSDNVESIFHSEAWRTAQRTRRRKRYGNYSNINLAWLSKLTSDFTSSGVIRDRVVTRIQWSSFALNRSFLIHFFEDDWSHARWIPSLSRKAGISVILLRSRFQHVSSETADFSALLCCPAYNCVSG